MWDLRGPPPSFVALKGHQGGGVSASFSADGTHVITASEDGTARIWDLRDSPATFAALEGHQGPVRFASFSPDRRHVVTASDDKTARVGFERREAQFHYLGGASGSGHRRLVLQ